MGTSLGRITASLAQPDEKLPEGLIKLLNANIHPPQELAESDVHIRAMYIVSDKINSYGGRFPVDEHPRLAELIVDSPVMVGHRKDKLPVGRTFHAVCLERNDSNWVKAYFYWLRRGEQAELLKDNIDGGVYRECSIGFTFGFPECSICGRDIRTCRHEPFQTYPSGGATRECHFNYRRIDRVLETSLVYRGAIPNTSISRDLHVDGSPQLITETSVLADDGEYLVIPRYEAIALDVEYSDGRLILTGSNGNRVDEALANRFPTGDLPDGMRTGGRLVGYRGRQRCSLSQLEAYLDGRPGAVSRLSLKLLPSSTLIDGPVGDNRAEFDIRMIPYRHASKGEIVARAGEIQTGVGTEVWAVDGDGDMESRGYLFAPADFHNRCSDGYTVSLQSGSSDATIYLRWKNEERKVAIRGFDAVLLGRGRRFVADVGEKTSLSERQLSESALRGDIEKCTVIGTGIRLCMTGYLTGEYVLRPILIGGKSRRLFYRLTAIRTR